MLLVLVIREDGMISKDTMMRGYRYDKRQKYSGFYERYIKRIFDIGCSLAALICFGWLYIVIGVLVKIKIGSPIFSFKKDPAGMRKYLNYVNFEP